MGGYDIPRRLIRRGNNRTHSNMAPLLVWNHQLLPNFYNKRQPPFFMSLRRDGSSSGNIKSIQATKRSSLGWVMIRFSSNICQVNKPEDIFVTVTSTKDIRRNGRTRRPLRWVSIPGHQRFESLNDKLSCVVKIDKSNFSYIPTSYRYLSRRKRYQRAAIRARWHQEWRFLN